MSTEKGLGVKVWALLIAALMLGSAFGGFKYAEATLPTQDGTWGEWFRETYGWFTSAFHLDYATAGRLLATNSGKNVTSTGISTGSGDDLTGVDWVNATSGDYSNLYANTLQTTNVTTTNLYAKGIGAWNGTAYRDVTNATAFPESEADYIIWTDGATPATYYAKNGHTGEVTSNTNGTTLIQGLIDNLELIDKGGNIYLKNGVYSLNAITIEKNDICIEGETKDNTKLNFAAGQNGITIGDGVNRIYYVKLRNISIIYQGTSTTDKKGILLNSPTNCLLENLYINLFYKGIYVQNDVGFSGYNVFNNIIIAGTTFGFYSDGIRYFNANLFNFMQISGKAGPTAGGIGLRLVAGYNNQFNSPLLEVWETGIKLETTASDANTFINSYFDVVTNGIDFAVGGKRNTFIGGDFQSCTNKIINDYAGSRNVFYNMKLYITESSGSATLTAATLFTNVTHGLAYTPAAGDINLTFGAGGSYNCTSVGISYYGATYFTIRGYDNTGTNKAPSNDITVNWKSSKP